MVRSIIDPKAWRQFPIRGVATGLVLVMLGGIGGCAKLSHYVQHHCFGAGHLAETQLPYFHCSDCGQIIPNDGHHCSFPLPEPPLYGYQATAWRPWPVGGIAHPIEMIESTEMLETPTMNPYGLEFPEIQVPTPPLPTATHSATTHSASTHSLQGQPPAALPVRHVAKPIRIVTAQALSPQPGAVDVGTSGPPTRVKNGNSIPNPTLQPPQVLPPQVLTDQAALPSRSPNFRPDALPTNRRAEHPQSPNLLQTSSVRFRMDMDGKNGRAPDGQKPVTPSPRRLEPVRIRPVDIRGWGSGVRG